MLGLYSREEILRIHPTHMCLSTHTYPHLPTPAHTTPAHSRTHPCTLLSTPSHFRAYINTHISAHTHTRDSTFYVVMFIINESMSNCQIFWRILLWVLVQAPNTRLATPLHQNSFNAKKIYTITFCSYATNFASSIKFWSP